MFTEQSKRRISVGLEDVIEKYFGDLAQEGEHLPLQDDLVYTRMADAAILVMIHSDEVQGWLKEQGYMKDD